jgi:putative ABC transport system permease protein
MGQEVGGDESHGRQIWLPLAQSVGWPGAPPPNISWLGAIARLREGSTIEQAESQLTGPIATLAARHVDWVRPQAILARLGAPPDAGIADMLLIIFTFLSAPLAVLAVSCANVANLQLGRATERVREIAVRVSFGATRAQVVRLLTIETIGFASLAVGISAAATLWIFNILEGFFPRILSIDWRVALFSVALLLAVTFATGVAPAWIVLRRSTHDILKQTRQTGGAAHSRLRSALVVVQVAVSLAMLCANGLFMQSLVAEQLAVPPAMRSQLMAEFDPRQLGASLSDPARFSQELRRRLADDPRVKLVALSRTDGVRYIMAGDDPAIRRFAPLVQITPDWLAMTQMTVLAGRALTEQDGAEAVVVSKTFADSFKGGGDILGSLVRLQMQEHEEARAAQIVGIVSDSQMSASLTGQPPEPTIYGSFQPTADPFTLRVQSDKVDELSSDLRNVVRALEPNMPWLSLRKGEDIYLGDVPTLKYIALAIGGLGLLALVLAVIGLYAVMSYIVLLRRHEISVRMAIGAKSKDIVLMMLGHAARLILIGGAIGLALVVILILILRAVFVGMSGIDPVAFLPHVGLIVLATLIAASIPAYFAARVDPMKVLKED